MEKTMTQLAMEARENAYAPYSHFQVGAALRCADGTVYQGCNVENASYSLGVCAERNAVFQAVADGRQKFSVLAIVGGTTAEQAEEVPCYPCGACLQVLAEFCDADFPILLADGVHPLGTLLPCRFGLTADK